MLKGKVILISGASSGIGEATALALAKYKVKLVITARRKESLEALAKKITAKGSKVHVVAADLTNVAQISKLVKSTLKIFGRIDVLVNTAGWGMNNWFEKFTFDEINNHFRINVLGLAELTRQVIPTMKKQRSGHIINMASYSSKIAFPPITVYASTKYAVEGLTDGLRRELGPWGIKVSRVHPASVSGTEFEEGSKKQNDIEYKSLPFGRITKGYVAEKLVSLIENPKPRLYLGRLYDIPVFFNRVFPGLVDLVAFWWVKKHRKIS